MTPPTYTGATWSNTVCPDGSIAGTTGNASCDGHYVDDTDLRAAPAECQIVN